MKLLHNDQIKIGTKRKPIYKEEWRENKLIIISNNENKIHPISNKLLKLKVELSNVRNNSMLNRWISIEAFLGMEVLDSHINYYFKKK